MAATLFWGVVTNHAFYDGNLYEMVLRYVPDERAVLQSPSEQEPFRALV